jgi:hypothetical protein
VYRSESGVGGGDGGVELGKQVSDIGGIPWEMCYDSPTNACGAVSPSPRMVAMGLPAASHSCSGAVQAQSPSSGCAAGLVMSCVLWAVLFAVLHHHRHPFLHRPQLCEDRVPTRDAEVAVPWTDHTYSIFLSNLW